MSCRHVFVLAAAVALTACGSTEAQPDAGPCWPEEFSSPGGQVQLGHVSGEFTTLTEGQNLQIETGPQGGFHFTLSARITDMDPGDPNDSLAGRNPRTRFTLFEEDGTVISEGQNCPTRLVYLKENGHTQLKFGLPILFPTSRVHEYYETTVRIQVEVIDSDGKYASDDVSIFATTPQILIPDAGVEADANTTVLDAGPL